MTADNSSQQVIPATELRDNGNSPCLKLPRLSRLIFEGIPRFELSSLHWTFQKEV
jgi:hypothetical protein